MIQATGNEGEDDDLQELDGRRNPAGRMFVPAW